MTIASVSQPVRGNGHPVLQLLFLFGLFLLGFGCFRYLRFTIQWLNYLFAFGVLCLPFATLRSIARLPKIPKVFGFIIISPILLVSLSLIAISVACDIELHPYTKDSCLQDLSQVEQAGYSVHLIQDTCGGAIAGVSWEVEQRKTVLPGLYVFRPIDYLPVGDNGRISSTGADSIEVNIPYDERDALRPAIKRGYMLKRHVYF